MPERKANRLAAQTVLAAVVWVISAVCMAAAADRDATSVKPPEVDSHEALRERIETLATELAQSAGKFGPDAVALQAALMLRSIEAGAVGPTAVGIQGASSCSAGRCLAIDVDSGLFFDSDKTTAATRLDYIWEHVAEPVLTAARRFEFSPPALELIFRYRTQSFAAQLDGRADPTAPARRYRRRVILSAELLDDLAAGVLAPGTLRSRATIDSEERADDDPRPGG